MSNISKIKVGDTTYDIEDTVARASGGSLSADVKQALLTIFQKVAYIDDDGQTYYDALEDALYPPANLVSISAVYTQSGEVYATTPLDDLKADLVVTAHYSDGTSGVVTAYILTGTLVEGTSQITVTYGGKTTAFNVTVSEIAMPYNLNFKFSDIVLSDGYIGDEGNVVSTEGSKYYDEFIPAIGFWLVSSTGQVYYNNNNLYLRVTEYDSTKEFIKRDAVNKGNPAVGDSANLNFIKMGYNESSIVESNADRFVACNILDASICTIQNSTIDSNGAVQSSEDAGISDFLPINEGYVLLRFTGLSDSALVVLYDENKNLINRGACTLHNTNYVFEASSNAKYVRFRCPMNPNGTVYVSYVK